MDIRIDGKAEAPVGPTGLPMFGVEDMPSDMEGGQETSKQSGIIPESCVPRDPEALSSPAVGMGDLRAVLDAWTAATERLEQTHQALQAEVQRLTRELEIKNRELARKNRLADLGLMASHVAHEVRNHLVPVGLYLNLLRRRLAGDPQGVQIIEKLETAFRALDNMVVDLLHFTRDREPKLQPVLLRGLVEEILSDLHTQCQAQKIDTHLQIPADLVVLGDADMLRRAVLNLLLNALDAMPDGGKITVSANAEGEMIEVAVADTGPGIPEDALPKVFEPFFTTKEGGTGLGLTIVMRIAETHQGRVLAENLREGGACIRLQWPGRPRAAKYQKGKHLEKAQPVKMFPGEIASAGQEPPVDNAELLAGNGTGRGQEESTHQFANKPAPAHFVSADAPSAGTVPRTHLATFVCRREVCRREEESVCHPANLLVGPTYRSGVQTGGGRAQ